MLAPLRRALCVAFVPRLFVERPHQHFIQLANRGVVALFRGGDRFLGQIVAQHIARVDRMHAHAPLLLVAAIALDAGAVFAAPGIEPSQIDEFLA
ncbi:hypothetical protein D3C76_1503200 [compost metagenome]